MDRVNTCIKPCEKPPIPNTRRFESIADSPYFPPVLNNANESSDVDEHPWMNKATFCKHYWMVFTILIAILITLYYYIYIHNKI